MANKNWVSFNPESTKDFSESFKKKLTTEIFVKLCDILGHKVSETEFEFQLEIGSPRYVQTSDNKLVSKASQLTTNNNYVFINAGLTTIFAKLHQLSIKWSSPDFKNPLDIHKKDVTDKKVNFFFCDDFPEAEIISELAPTKIKTKVESGFKFDVCYYLIVFPDVSIIFDFEEKPSEETLNEVRNEVKKFGDKFKTVFIHDLQVYKGYYMIPINHNTIDFGNYSKKDFDKDVQNFDFLLKNINDNKKITSLRQIKFQ